MSNKREEVIIGIGSKNPTKINATKIAFEKYYQIHYLHSFLVDSRVPDQPIGFEETISGAVNRAKGAFSALKPSKNNDIKPFGVGIEAGLIKIPYTLTGYMDFQFCVIIDELGKISLGTGVSFEYPSQIVEQILQNEDLEIGNLLGNMAHNINLKYEAGAIGFLSKNQMNRTELLTSAVMCALLPIINKELYYKK